MEPEKGKYTAQVLRPGVTWIYDGINDSIYVDESEDEAFVIDTGMAEASLVEFIRKEVTQKPLTLVVTHGHLDHTMRAAEFSHFYMSDLDDQLIPKEAKVDLSRRINIEDGDTISISGLSLQVVAAEGHTPGSVLFVDKSKKLVFCGDAFGSGWQLWLQFPEAPCLSVFSDMCLRVLGTMKSMGADETYTWLGGHYEQQFLRDESAPNPPSLILVADMAELCQRLVDGSIKGVHSDERSFDEAEMFEGVFGRAALLYKERQLK